MALPFNAVQHFEPALTDLVKTLKRPSCFSKAFSKTLCYDCVKNNTFLCDVLEAVVDTCDLYTIFIIFDFLFSGLTIFLPYIITFNSYFLYFGYRY